MSRKAARHAAADFLSAPQIPGIGTVFASPPKISRSSDALAGLPAGTPSGSVLYVEIMHVTETRIALGGDTSGAKWAVYSLRLHLLFRSRQGKAEAAMDDHDDQVEAILERIRGDRTLGTGGIPSLGFVDYGQDSAGITVDTGMPKEGASSTLVWTLIDGNFRRFLLA